MLTGLDVVRPVGFICFDFEKPNTLPQPMVIKVIFSSINGQFIIKLLKFCQSIWVHEYQFQPGLAFYKQTCLKAKYLTAFVGFIHDFLPSRTYFRFAHFRLSYVQKRYQIKCYFWTKKSHLLLYKKLKKVVALNLQT